MCSNSSWQNSPTTEVTIYFQNFSRADSRVSRHDNTTFGTSLATGNETHGPWFMGAPLDILSRGPEFLVTPLVRCPLVGRVCALPHVVISLFRDSDFEDLATGLLQSSGPHVWNSLPTEIRQSLNNLLLFKSKLKTVLFQQSWALLWIHI